MLRKVREMVAQDGIAPKTMLDPKGAMQEGVVLLSGAEREPDAPESVEGLEGGSGNVGAIVPDAAAVKGRPIRD